MVVIREGGKGREGEWRGPPAHPTRHHTGTHEVYVKWLARGININVEKTLTALCPPRPA